jgi:hypothetical protein
MKVPHAFILGFFGGLGFEGLISKISGLATISKNGS